MNIPKALQHHAKAGAALNSGDHQTARHHIGHMLAALKHGSPNGAPTQPDTGPTGIPQAPAGPSIRARLAGMKQKPVASSPGAL